MTKSLPDSQRAEKIVAYLSDWTFDFYFDCFTLDKSPTEEANDYGLVKTVILVKFSAQKTESEVMREAFTFRYEGEDLPTSLSSADRF